MTWGSSAGTVEFTRTDTSGPLTVNYGGGSVNFIDGQQTADATITPSWNMFSQYATVNVCSGVGYAPDGQNGTAVLAASAAGAIRETVGGASQPIMLDSPTPGQLTVSISQQPESEPCWVWFLAAGTAVLGTDYTLALDGSPAGVTLSDSFGGTMLGVGFSETARPPRRWTSPPQVPGRFGDTTVVIAATGGFLGPWSGYGPPGTTSNGPISFDASSAPLVFTLVDDRPKVAIGDAVAGEGDTETFRVSVAYSPWASSGGSAILDYQTQDGTSYGGLGGVATAWTDYTPASGQLAISSSQTSQTFTVQTYLGDGTGNLNFAANVTDDSVRAAARPPWRSWGRRRGAHRAGHAQSHGEHHLAGRHVERLTLSYDGTCVELDLTATVDPALAAGGDWHVVLPNVPGLAFWTARPAACSSLRTPTAMSCMTRCHRPAITATRSGSRSIPTAPLAPCSTRFPSRWRWARRSPASPPRPARPMADPAGVVSATGVVGVGASPWVKRGSSTASVPRVGHTSI